MNRPEPNQIVMAERSTGEWVEAEYLGSPISEFRDGQFEGLAFARTDETKELFYAFNWKPVENEADKERDEMLTLLAERFCAANLPRTMNPDNGIIFNPPIGDEIPDHLWPTGTNLLTVDEAKQLFDQILKPDEFIARRAMNIYVVEDHGNSPGTVYAILRHDKDAEDFADMLNEIGIAAEVHERKLWEGQPALLGVNE